MRLAAVLAALATMVVGAGTASAGGRPGGVPGGPPVTLADGLAGPLQIDAAGPNVLVAQDFAGVVSSVGRNGRVTDLVSEPGRETAGVAAGPFGSVFYTSGEQGTSFDLEVRDLRGHTRVVADLQGYEASHNPDRGNTYGFVGISTDCASQVPAEFGPATYQGVVDSHPYALATTPFGILVADAAGNDILLVDWFGRIHLVSVLAPQPTVVTADAAAASGLPACTVGSTYNFEPVPTDVEVGRGGQLYVTTLPGGPEDPSLGARGSVYRINPWNGRTSLVATGFLGATNLAVAPNGTIYVAELFGGQISKVVRGGPKPVVAVDSPAAVEWDHGRLLVTSEGFGSGKLLSIRA